MNGDTPGGRGPPECRAEGNPEREKRAPLLATLYCTLPRFPNLLAQQLRRRASLPGPWAGEVSGHRVWLQEQIPDGTQTTRAGRRSCY